MIVIMLVLAGILAPQFVKYVQKARIAADVASAQELAKAIQVMVTNGENIEEARVVSAGEEYYHVYPSWMASWIPAGYEIHGLDGVSKVPESKIDKNRGWVIEYTSDGKVFIGLMNPNPMISNGYVLYPEYMEDVDVWRLDVHDFY